jgi:phosphoribosylformylglycinamidine synthase
MEKHVLGVDGMKRSEIRIGIIMIEGTNCDMEMYQSFRRLGAQPEIIHLKQLLGTDVSAEEKRSLFDYQCLMIPGGFSAGDYIRAGAIFAARMKSRLEDDLINFVREGHLIGGICNGFQVLVELGLLPAFDTPMSMCPQAALVINDSSRFECRPTILKHENNGNCAFTLTIPKDKIMMFPSAHAEGKFTFDKEFEKQNLKRLIDNDQIVFRYVDENGDYAQYPWCPNGSLYNIAGICNADGNVFGMMPHPERVFFKWQYQDFSRFRYGQRAERKDIRDESGDGKAVFESIISYIERKF